jgi:hypothetical protein
LVNKTPPAVPKLNATIPIPKIIKVFTFKNVAEVAVEEVATEVEADVE